MSYFLIAAFLAVWGVIGYKLYVSYNPSEKEALNPMKSTSQMKNDTIETPLLFNYEDPFLANIPIPKEQQSMQSISNTATPIHTTPHPVIYSPSPSLPIASGIKYKGIIINNSKGNKVIAISLQGKESIMTLGDKIGGFKLLKVYNEDSIQMLFDKMKYVYHR